MHLHNIKYKIAVGPWLPHHFLFSCLALSDAGAADPQSSELLFYILCCVSAFFHLNKKTGLTIPLEPKYCLLGILG